MAGDAREQLTRSLNCPARLGRALDGLPDKTLQSLARAVDKTLDEERRQLERAYEQALPGWIRPWVLRRLRREPA